MFCHWTPPTPPPHACSLDHKYLDSYTFFCLSVSVHLYWDTSPTQFLSIDVNLLKLKLRLGTVIWSQLLYFKVLTQPEEQNTVQSFDYLRSRACTYVYLRICGSAAH